MASWSQHSDTVQRLPDWLPAAVRSQPAWRWLGGSAVLLALLWYLRRRRRRLPPGPWGFPVVGAVHCIGREMHRDLMKLRKTYGDIISFRLGGRLHVALNGYPLIKDALVNRGEDFADRPVHHLAALLDFNDEIFTSPYNESWKSSRKFASMTLKKFGMGGCGLIEDKVLTEVARIMEHLRDSSGTPIQLNRLILNGIARAQTSILFSSEYSADDPAVDQLVETIRSWFDASFNPSLLKANRFPSWLAKILYKKPFEAALAMKRQMNTYIQEKLEEHRATLDTNNLRDVMDAYLAEREDLDEERLTYTLLVFLPDGVDTLSGIILWGFLYIIYTPEVQDEIQKELDAVVGRSGRPTMVHRKELLYLQATILETFRITNIAPLASPHKSLQNTTLAGYDIPTSAVIWPNLYSVHMDPETFPDPEKFDPHHFLDGSGKLKNVDRCIPFSLGRRMCLGEQISKMETFLFLANMLHQFRFRFPPAEPAAALDPHMIGTVLRLPPNFSVIAVPR